MSQTLYRFWSARDELLYVGISVRPWDRWKQHAGEKPWWEEVAKVTLEAFDTRDLVRAAELTAIKTEEPRYNIADMPRPADAGDDEAEFDGIHSPSETGTDGEGWWAIGCSCGWEGRNDEYASHIVAVEFEAAFGLAKHRSVEPRIRRPSVKFISDMWPKSGPKLPRKWKFYALEWLDDGLTRDEVRDAFATALEAWADGRTENPWNYAGGVMRRLLAEKEAARGDLGG